MVVPLKWLRMLRSSCFKRSCDLSHSHSPPISWCVPWKTVSKFVHCPVIEVDQASEPGRWARVQPTSLGDHFPPFSHYHQLEWWSMIIKQAFPKICCILFVWPGSNRAKTNDENSIARQSVAEQTPSLIGLVGLLWWHNVCWVTTVFPRSTLSKQVDWTKST